MLLRVFFVFRVSFHVSFRAKNDMFYSSNINPLTPTNNRILVLYLPLFVSYFDFTETLSEFNRLRQRFCFGGDCFHRNRLRQGFWFGRDLDCQPCESLSRCGAVSQAQTDSHKVSVLVVIWNANPARVYFEYKKFLANFSHYGFFLYGCPNMVYENSGFQVLI